MMSLEKGGVAYHNYQWLLNKTRGLNNKKANLQTNN